MFLLPQSSRAQTEPEPILFPPILKNFPVIRTFLQIQDAEGRFIHNLQNENFSILEDGLSIPSVSVDEQKTGAQIVTVINPGSTFALRNSQAISRYEFILDALNNWLTSRLGSTVDDLSLLITGEPGILHVQDPQTLIEKLTSEATTDRQFTPSLDVVFQALEIAADPSPRPGMGRSVLFITEPLQEIDSQSLLNLSTRAQELGIKIFVWMVGSTEGENRIESEQLKALAESTGGKFFAFTGIEEFPSPEEYFEPSRSVYRISYPSQIRTGGTHQLIAEIQALDGTQTTQPRSFETNISAPIPVLINPPLEIFRKQPQEEEQETKIPSTEAAYSPEQQELQILVDFPDGRIRPLKRTSLLVDNLLVDENTSEPYDRFSWDLTPYITDGNHILRVEAEDELDLTGFSIDHQVLVTIEKNITNPAIIIKRNLPVLTLAAILVAGVVLFLILVLGGRIKPFQPGKKHPRKRKDDPTTQPVPIGDESTRPKESWVNRFHWRQRQSVNRTLAFLTPLEEEGSGKKQSTKRKTKALSKSSRREVHSPPIPISNDQVNIGSDPLLADLILVDPSIENLHARLTRLPDGSFRLADEQSIAGTWINYTPVSSQGARLEHGDLVHIGRVGFRFTLRRPDRVRRPVVIPATPQTNGVSNPKEEEPPPPDQGMTP